MLIIFQEIDCLNASYIITWIKVLLLVNQKAFSWPKHLVEFEDCYSNSAALELFYLYNLHFWYIQAWPGLMCVSQYKFVTILKIFYEYSMTFGCGILCVAPPSFFMLELIFSTSAFRWTVFIVLKLMLYL